MAFFDWLNSRVTRMNWFDVGLLKVCVAAAVLLVAKLWPVLLTPRWEIFAGVFIITYIPLFVKLFMRGDGNA